MCATYKFHKQFKQTLILPLFNTSLLSLLLFFPTNYISSIFLFSPIPHAKTVQALLWYERSLDNEMMRETAHNIFNQPMSVRFSI